MTTRPTHNSPVRMARTAVRLAACITLALSGLALASTYKHGTYVAGRSGGVTISLSVGASRFAVQRISFPEQCSNKSSSFTDAFTFVHGSQASLAGRIDRHGHLAGKYRGAGGTVTVSGRVRGSRATVRAVERSTYSPPGAGTFKCSGTHTFHATSG